MEAYRAEVSCMNRLRHEIVTLRQLVATQQKQISQLNETCDQLRQEKFNVGKSHTMFLIVKFHRSITTT